MPNVLSGEHMRPYYSYSDLRKDIATLNRGLTGQPPLREEEFFPSNIVTAAEQTKLAHDYLAMIEQELSEGLHSDGKTQPQYQESAAIIKTAGQKILDDFAMRSEEAQKNLKQIEQKRDEAKILQGDVQEYFEKESLAVEALHQEGQKQLDIANQGITSIQRKLRQLQEESKEELHTANEDLALANAERLKAREKIKEADRRQKRAVEILNTPASANKPNMADIEQQEKLAIKECEIVNQFITVGNELIAAKGCLDIAAKKSSVREARDEVKLAIQHQQLAERTLQTVVFSALSERVNSIYKSQSLIAHPDKKEAQEEKSTSNVDIVALNGSKDRIDRCLRDIQNYLVLARDRAFYVTLPPFIAFLKTENDPAATKLRTLLNDRFILRGMAYFHMAKGFSFDHVKDFYYENLKGKDPACANVFNLFSANANELAHEEIALESWIPFYQELASLQDTLSAARDAAADKLNTFLNDRLITENIRRLYAVNKFTFADLAKLYDHHLKGKNESRADVFLIFADDDYVGRLLGLAEVQHFHDTKYLRRKQALEDIEALFTTQEFSDNYDANYKEQQPLTVDFYQRMDYSPFHKLCVHTIEDLNSQRFYMVRLPIEPTYLPPPLFAAEKEQLLKIAFAENEKYCRVDSKPAVKIGSPHETSLAPHRQKLENIFRMFNRNNQALYDAIESKVIQRIENKRKKLQHVRQQKVDKLKKNNPAIEDEAILNDKNIKFLDVRINAVGEAANDVRKVITETCQQAVEQNHPEWLCLGYNHIKDEKHLYRRVVGVLNKYANDDDISKPRNPLGFWFKRIIGVLASILNFNNSCRYSLFYTDTKKAMYQGADDLTESVLKNMPAALGV